MCVCTHGHAAVLTRETTTSFLTLPSPEEKKDAPQLFLLKADGEAPTSRRQAADLSVIKHFLREKGLSATYRPKGTLHAELEFYYSYLHVFICRLPALVSVPTQAQPRISLRHAYSLCGL